MKKFSRVFFAAAIGFLLWFVLGFVGDGLFITAKYAFRFCKWLLCDAGTLKYNIAMAVLCAIVCVLCQLREEQVQK